jgi:hypothetical protein
VSLSEKLYVDDCAALTVQMMPDIPPSNSRLTLSEILDAAIGRPKPSGYPEFSTAEALRMWRSKRGLTDAPLRNSKN